MQSSRAKNAVASYANNSAILAQRFHKEKLFAQQFES
jgi:hypothetical protein